MSYTGASLADGQVSGSLATVYSVPSTNRVVVRTFTVFNTGSGSETVKVYIKRLGSTARQFGIAVLSQDESKDFIEQPITLSSEDVIQAVTSTGSVVDFVITGAVE